MFILKRQDVEIKNIPHPKKPDSQIPILSYQGQTFRLLSFFGAEQEEDARSLWRDLTDNRGKACVLLEEPDRFSVWGKVRLDALDEGDDGKDINPASLPLIQASLLLLQALYLDVEDLLGGKQANLFEQEVAKVLTQWRFPQVTSEKVVKSLLTIDPLATQVPPWQELHLQRLLEEMHRIGKGYFGNANFTERALDALEDMPKGDRQTFISWLELSPPGKLWK